MGCHYVYLVDAETEAEVHKHVEAEPRGYDEEEALAACHPCSCDEEQHEQCLHYVAYRRAVADEDGARLLYVFHEMVLMEL